jgi:FkbM family methyltransferase
MSLVNGSASMEPSFADIIDHPVPSISIVDVGAMEDGKDRYHQLVADGLATVTGFEPNPEQYHRLQGRGAPYRYLPYFLGDGNVANFNITRYPGCCSLFRSDPKVIDLFSTIDAGTSGGNFFIERTEPVKTVRLDDIAELTIDYIKLDVQGSELDIMRHGTGKLAGAVVIECEVEFLPIYEGQPLFGDIQVFLRDHGFVLHKFVDCAGRPFRPFWPQNPFLPISQLLWADAIFVRDFTRLELFSDDALVKAAAILDTVYTSVDLAARFLGEYDRRRGTKTHQRYVSCLSSRSLSLQFLNLKAEP